MRGKYFRYLYENLDGGLFHTGNIYDKEEKKSTNYIYMVGGYCGNVKKEQKPGSYSFRMTHLSGFSENPLRYIEEDVISYQIDILVLGCYTVKYVNRLIDIVKEHEIETLILPYLAPIQRLMLEEEAKSGSQGGRHFISFLQDPYKFLKKFGVENVYFLYGNGEAIDREPEELEQGFHFEVIDDELRRLIWKMEGYFVPVVRAGYIVENGWLFYFGMYGLDMQSISGFILDYFSNDENICELSENIQEDYTAQLGRLAQNYMRKFGNVPITSVIMFEGPLYAFPSENDSLMTEKEFSRKERCEICARYERNGTGACMIGCTYRKDHDVMQHHKGKDLEEMRFGMLMLGNVNLNRYVSEIITRFWRVRLRIRGVCVPNCGRGEDWNHQILEMSSSEDRVYWICGKHDITSAGVVSDIVMSAQNGRFLSVDRGQGCCFAGYIIPKEDF